MKTDKILTLCWNIMSIVCYGIVCFLQCLVVDCIRSLQIYAHNFGIQLFNSYEKAHDVIN